MTVDDARNAVISVLQAIQAKSALPCPALDGSTVPPKKLEKFDSTVWPVAATLVARKLGVKIPNTVHIFGGEKGKPLLSINQIAELIVKKHLPKAPVKAAA
jgi:hypothetical protein